MVGRNDRHLTQRVTMKSLLRRLAILFVISCGLAAIPVHVGAQHGTSTLSVDSAALDRLVADGELRSRSLASKDARTRLHAAIAVGRLDKIDERTLRSMVVLLVDALPQVQIEAARSLGHLRESSPSIIDGLLRLLTSEHERVVATAAVALSNLTSEARVIDQLAKKLDHRDAYVRERVAYALSRVEPLSYRHSSSIPAVTMLTQCLSDSDHNVREMAAYALAKIEPRSQETISELARLLAADKHPGVRESAAFALARIGPPARSAVDLLLSRINDSDPDVRENVAYALGEIEVLPKAAFSKLLERLVADKTPAVRRAITVAVGRIVYRSANRPTDTSVAVLRQGLKSQIPEVRATTLGVLPSFQDSKQLVPELFEAFNSSDIETKRAVSGVLASAGPFDRKHLPTLISALSVRDRSVKAFVLDALSWYPEHADEIVPHVIPFVDQQDPLLQEKAIFTIARIGPMARAALPSLIDALKSRTDRIRSLAAWAIAELEPQSSDAVQPLSEMLETTSNDKALENVVFAIKKLGPYARAAWPKLVPFLAHRSNAVRKHALEALVNAPLDSSDREVASAMLATFPRLQNSSYVDARICVIRSLGKIGAQDQGVQSLLLNQLADEETLEVRQAAAFAIAELGVDWPAAEKSLAELLKTDDELTATYATLALLNMNSPARAAWPELVRALGHESSLVRKYAIRKLRESQFDSVDLVYDLCEIADNSSYEESRIYAIECLGMTRQDGEPVKHLLLTALHQHERPSVQKAAVGAMGRIGAKWKEAAQPLGRILSNWSDDDSVLLDVGQVLAQMGTDSRPAWSALIKALGHHNEQLRMTAGNAIRGMPLGASDRVLCHDLFDVLHSDYASSKEIAGKSLVQIGPTAMPVIVNRYDGKTTQLDKESLAIVQQSIDDIISNLADDDLLFIAQLEQVTAFLQREGLSTEVATSKLRAIRSRQSNSRRLMFVIASILPCAALVCYACWAVNKQPNVWVFFYRAVDFVLSTSVRIPKLGALADRLRRSRLPFPYGRIRIAWIKEFETAKNPPASVARLPESLLAEFSNHVDFLDAWVKRTLPEATSHFSKLHDPGELSLQPGEDIELPLCKLREEMESHPLPINIIGESKECLTWIAREIARRAAAGTLLGHNVIPVLIEGARDDSFLRLLCVDGKERGTTAVDNDRRKSNVAQNKSDRLVKYVAERLRTIVRADRTQREPLQLTRQLLAKRRVVVIVDRFCSLSEQTRTLFESKAMEGFPIAALVITSSDQGLSEAIPIHL